MYDDYQALNSTTRNLNIFRPEPYSRLIADVIFKFTLLNETARIVVWISLLLIYW